MKKNFLVCLGLLLGSPLPAGAQPRFDQLLENVAPILNEAEAYHTPGEPRDAADPLSLTLQRCVDLALEQNTETLVAETDVALRRATARQARARYFPEIQAGVIYNYVDDLETEIDGGLLGSFFDTESFIPEKDTVTTRLTVNQVLFAGGQIDAAVKAARYLAASEAWRRDAVRAEVAFQARQAYHDALRARAAAAVAEEALAAFERHLRDTEILEREGALTAFEVMRARSEVAAREAGLVSARAAVKQADLTLRQILALPADQPLVCDPAITLRPVEAAPAQLIARAREQRPEIRALQEALAAARQEARGVKGKYLPQANATVIWEDVEGGGQSTPGGWQVNVAAQWDLYLGGQRKHERAEKRARTESLQYQLADLERLVAIEVERACVQLDEAAAAMRANNENVELAAESVRLAKVRYKEGIGTQTEIIDAELEQSRARSTLVEAVRDYHVARAALLRATGRARPAAAPDQAGAPAHPKEK